MDRVNTFNEDSFKQLYGQAAGGAKDITATEYVENIENSRVHQRFHDDLKKRMDNAYGLGGGAIQGQEMSREKSAINTMTVSLHQTAKQLWLNKEAIDKQGREIDEALALLANPHFKSAFETVFRALGVGVS
jgi:urocanate hydratase